MTGYGETGQQTKFMHAGVCVSAEERAVEIFEGLFGLERAKDFEAPAELIRNLFEIHESVRILVYAAGPVEIEVFLSATRAGRPAGFGHACLAVADRAAVIAKVEAMGLPVFRHARPDGSFIVFFKDLDGNLYELK